VRAQPAAATLDARWADLNSSDDGKATRALLALATSPKETTAFLKDHLKPVKADPKRVAQLLKALDSNTFVIRQQAVTELEYYGKYIKTDLETALKGDINVGAKRYIEQLIDKMPKEAKKGAPMPPANPLAGRSISVSNINGQIQIMVDGRPLDLTPATPPPPPPGPPQGWVRAVRAVTLLEHLGTPEAQAILQSIASGESDALPTAAAREALERLKKQ
jgi:hypothetical protein